MDKNGRDKEYIIRNILAHAYIKIDTKIVWETVAKDIVDLKANLSKIEMSTIRRLSLLVLHITLNLVRRIKT